MLFTFLNKRYSVTLDRKLNPLTSRASKSTVHPRRQKYMLINDKYALFKTKLVLQAKGRKDMSLWYPRLAFNLCYFSNDGFAEMFYSLEYLTE